MLASSTSVPPALDAPDARDVERIATGDQRRQQSLSETRDGGEAGVQDLLAGFRGAATAERPAGGVEHGRRVDQPTHLHDPAKRSWAERRALRETQCAALHIEHA